MKTRAARVWLADAASWIFNGARLKLMANDSPMTEDPADYKEASGYESHLLIQPRWRFDVEKTPIIGSYEPLTMRITKPQKVFGYFIQSEDAAIVHSEKFAQPVEINAGDSIVIHPRIAVVVRDRDTTARLAGG